MGTSSFIDILDSALTKSVLGTTKIYVIYQTAWTLWLHRNNRVYQNRPLRFAPQINAEMARAYLEGASQYTASHKKRRRMTQAMAFIIPHDK